jgi:hypothetical protein
MDPIKLGDALDEIRAYRDFIGQFNYPDNVSRTKACHIKADDLRQLLDETNGDGIRCYFGMRTMTDGPLEGRQVTCLVMVGTTWNEDEGTYIDTVLIEGESKLYELTTPCPDTCDINSPLFNLPHQ